MQNSHLSPETIEKVRAFTALSSPAGKQAVQFLQENPPLPADPDEAAAQALAAILDPAVPLLPGAVFDELARRNAALMGESEAEIKATLSRQIGLLEASASRLMHKAANAQNPAAAGEFLRNGLAVQRVLLAALGAIHAMDKAKGVDLPSIVG